MAIYDYEINRLDGSPADLHEYEGQVTLVVNVASQCGFTPQYEGLQRLYEQYRDRGFTVLGFPCNQFLGQEPGSAEEIATFCSTNYGVSFPLFEKIEVNGDDRHGVFEELTATPDSDGNAGDVGWNFEKFLIAPDGQVVGRFRTGVVPEDPQVIEAIEANLPR